ncbi:MAG: T9SS type A sorting domain-containing protein [Bacteroidota bacterium]
MNNFTQTPTKGLLILLLFFSSLAVHGQDGLYNLRFEMSSFDCDNNTLSLAVEISASVDTFLVTNQNYRFSFNRSAVAPIPSTINNSNPTGAGGPVSIESENELSGFVFKDGYSSFFLAHTLVGSQDTVGSYNVAMAAGDGYPVYPGEWIRVGTLNFQVIDPDEDLNLWFHTQDPALFPNTFIGGGIPGNPIGYEVDEDTYTNFLNNMDNICNTILPIELSHFSATDLGCSIQLDWTTLTETNNAYFDIERSFDGLNFESIARIEGAGNSSSPINYEYIDDRVGVVNYYQLRQVDFDGTTTVSEQIIVNSSCFDDELQNTITSIYPNPVGKQKATIQFYTTLPSSNASIIVTDISGRLRMQQNVEINQGPNQLVFDPSGLEPGVYVVQLIGGDWYSSTQKFIKVQ